MSFRRNLVKFAAVLSVFFTGISFINVPNQTQTVHAAEQSTTEKREAVADLAKKQPDGLLNAFKVAQINRVLQPLKEIMSDEPAAACLDLVSEVETGMEKSRNSYSDVAMILSQYREACGEYLSKYYEVDWDIRL